MLDTKLQRTAPIQVVKSSYQTDLPYPVAKTFITVLLDSLTSELKHPGLVQAGVLFWSNIYLCCAAH